MTWIFFEFNSRRFRTNIILYRKFNRPSFMRPTSLMGTVIKIKDMVHKFSVSFYVRSNYSNKDGMEPVISRINLDGKRLSIGSTGVKVMPGIRLGVIVSDPYIGIVHHLDPVKRTYLTDRELHAFIVKKLGTKRLERVRDVFVFACYMGMYYREISRLKDDDVVESCGKKWINTHRKKNGHKDK